ncbi:MAG: hypothetical protein ACJ8C4_18905 [Gemmataceae bacterium]
MRHTRLPIPEIGLIAGTRGALGFGLGLLLADRFDEKQRQTIGWSLVAIGVLSTFPLVADVFRKMESDFGSTPKPSSRGAKQPMFSG